MSEVPFSTAVLVEGMLKQSSAGTSNQPCDRREGSEEVAARLVARPLARGGCCAGKQQEQVLLLVFCALEEKNPKPYCTASQ